VSDSCHTRQKKKDIWTMASDERKEAVRYFFFGVVFPLLHIMNIMNLKSNDPRASKWARLSMILFVIEAILLTIGVALIAVFNILALTLR
jgi:hypothetical protein